ncbi:hypothetical protein [Yersinia mollaretii]|nr:hypothetical protein [Yersinia mollaretii]
MARPSDLESQRGFALLDGVGFGAVLVFGLVALLGFRQLSTETARFY